MWLLVIVLLSPLPGFDQVTILKRYSESAPCEADRKYVGFEMAEAYPYDATFRIECRCHHQEI